jgi:hypothetical protein
LIFKPCLVTLSNSADTWLARTEAYLSWPALIDHVKVNIINLEDLKKNKKASGREKDLIDLKN